MHYHQPLLVLPLDFQGLPRTFEDPFGCPYYVSGHTQSLQTALLLVTDTPFPQPPPTFVCIFLAYKLMESHYIIIWFILPVKHT